MTKDKVKETLIDLLCLSVFKLAMEGVYIFGTVVQYAYLGRYLDFNLSKYIAGWITFIVFVFFISKIKNTHIAYMVNILFLLSGVSNLSIYGLKNYKTSHFLCVILFWLLLVIGAGLIKEEQEDSDRFIKKHEDFKHNNRNVDILFLCTIVLTIYLALRCGISRIDLVNIYSIRNAFRQKSLSSINTYLLSWNATVFLPWCCIQYISKKKYIRTLLCLMLAFIMFSINGMKTWLFLYFVIFAIYIMSKRFSTNHIFRCIVLGISALLGFAIFEIFNQKNYLFSGLLDRIMILPGEINYYYMIFFDEHPALCLRESILKSFASSPYNPVSPVQISQMFMKEAYYHFANNGMLGDAYGNFKLLGVVIYPFMISFSLHILYKYFYVADKGINLAIYFILMWLLTNTSFFTWLMTGGYLMYIALSYIHQKYKIVLRKEIQIKDKEWEIDDEL